MEHIKIIAEIGINHNGDINIAKNLINIAKGAGCDYVKFQKRNPEVCVPTHMRDKLKDTPWGTMTYLDYKKKIEFSEEEYIELFKFCENNNIKCFASVWDKDSVDFMVDKMNCKIGKIPSALLTNMDLCVYARSKFEFLIISTGMSTENEIDKCIRYINPDVIMHTNSTYPCPVEDLNLNYITHLKNKYQNNYQYRNPEIGYSGHEFGLVTTFATLPLGVTWIERHITLDRTMWGSDQMSSVEPTGLIKLVKGIRDIEKAFQYIPQNRILFSKEKEKRETLKY